LVRNVHETAVFHICRDARLWRPEKKDVSILQAIGRGESDKKRQVKEFHVTRVQSRGKKSGWDRTRWSREWDRYKIYDLVREKRISKRTCTNSPEAFFVLEERARKNA